MPIGHKISLHESTTGEAILASPFRKICIFFLHLINNPHEIFNE